MEDQLVGTIKTKFTTIFEQGKLQCGNEGVLSNIKVAYYSFQEKERLVSILPKMPKGVFFWIAYHSNRHKK